MCAIEKGALFNLLPMTVITVIDNWLSVLEHHIIFNNFVIKIHGPRNPVLRIATYEDKKCLQ